MGQRPEPPPARILLVLPDEQTLEVHLYERYRAARGHPWRFRIGVPSWIATEEGVSAAEYSVWVTDRQLRPITGADLSNVPTRRHPSTLPPPEPSGWVVRPARGRRGGTVVHDAACPEAAGGGVELGTLEALDALMRPGARACHDCAAAGVLVPALHLGEGHG